MSDPPIEPVGDATADLPGPDDQEIDLNAVLPDPSEFGESFDDPVGSHGDFHDRPDFRGHDEVLQHEEDGE